MSSKPAFALAVNSASVSPFKRTTSTGSKFDTKTAGKGADQLAAWAEGVPVGAPVMITTCSRLAWAHNRDEVALALQRTLGWPAKLDRVVAAAEAQQLQDREAFMDQLRQDKDTFAEELEAWDVEIRALASLGDGLTYSAVWTGVVRAQHSELYSFYLSTSDGARIWLDDTMLIAAWPLSSRRTSSASAAPARSRYSHAAVIPPGSSAMYVFGGYSGEDAALSDTFDRCDVTTGVCVNLNLGCHGASTSLAPGLFVLTSS